MISFDNTEIAFIDKSDKQLKKAFWLFFLVKYRWLTFLGSKALLLANTFRIPISWALENTVFNHFCGGVNPSDSIPRMQELYNCNIKTILDYAAEGVESEKEFNRATDRIVETIEIAQFHPEIASGVFKFTGIAKTSLLQKVSMGNPLSSKEEEQWNSVKERAHRICQTAAKYNVPVMIDAEETWLQDAIDELAQELMLAYNKQKPLVYNTLQMYRVDKLFYLKSDFKNSREKGYFPAYKLVRGAYMEKERNRAVKMYYSSPIQESKTATDNAYDEGIRFCLENIEELAVCIGTHNENSCTKAVELMHDLGIEKQHSHVFFSQLLGMSDHISYNLAKEGYSVSKYVPYGPLRMVMPYLIRRAEENTSVAGQTSRELFLIKKELKRRKNI